MPKNTPNHSPVQNSTLIILTPLITRLWLATQRREHRRFWRDAGAYARVQETLLLDMVRRHQNTSFGRNHNFAVIRSYADYVQRVPVLADWAVMQPYLQSIANGQPHILFSDTIERMEETSGSTGFSKMIPYTAPLKRSFEYSVAVWMCELHAANPAAFRGKSYWSISPALKPARTTASGIPIGLEGDTAYFNPLTAWLLRQIMVQPGVKKERDSDLFYQKTIAALLQNRQLSFISVWSPTFFLQLDRYLQEHHYQFGVAANFTWSDVFPNLSCLSCWTDAQAAIWVVRVQERLGAVEIQSKGLLSTECVTTIPIGLKGTPVLAYRSHFFEFRDQASGFIHLAHQLEEGRAYEVICTNGAGLYRYATQDWVLMEGYCRGLPILRFTGRKSAISDIVGEKLSEMQVIAALQKSGFADAFEEVVVVPEKAGQAAARYRIIAYRIRQPAFDAMAAVAAFEVVLRQNPYYAQALDAQQLAPAQVREVTSSPVARIKRYLMEERKIREGDIKIPVLVRLSDGVWEALVALI